MENQNTPVNPYLKGLLMVFSALLIGLVTFALMAVWLNNYTDFSAGLSEMNNIFLVILITIGVVCYAASKILFKKQIETAKRHLDLKSKLVEYRSALVMKYALIEAPAFMGILFYMLTNDYLMLSFSGVLIVLFYFNKPTKENVARELELNPDEMERLDHMDMSGN